MSRLRGRAIMRTLVLWLSTAIALVLVSLIPGLLTITTLSTALWAAVVISLIDALVWPIVLYFALPLTVLTLGLIVVAVNGIVLLLVSQFTPGFHVDGFWAGLAAALAGHDCQHRRRVAARDRRRRLLVSLRRRALPAPRRAGRGHRRAGALLPGDRRTRTRHARARDARRQCAAPRETRPRGLTRADTLGDRLVERRPVPARPASCTAATRTCRPSAGGRRIAARRS